MAAASDFPSPALRSVAQQIWQAGVAAVDSATLVRTAMSIEGRTLRICGQEHDLATAQRIAVVGGGKAGAGMAAAVESVLRGTGFDERLCGWINVPSNCVTELDRIQLHAARPAGVNEPTAAGVIGSNHILELVSGLETNDVCLVLLSGGGSALLPAPDQGISLADKQRVTQLLMQSGATIDELNCVRKQLSRIKGGGLARCSTAGYNASLIISDVVGDPLDVIASGPTVPNPDQPARAVQVLDKFDPHRTMTPPSVIELLNSRPQTAPQPPRTRFHNHVIGNNQVAVSAACDRAQQLGYEVHNLGSDNRGVAREVGRELSVTARRLRDSRCRPTCLISGGEPIVHLLPSDRPRKGGRNQELVLAALESCWNDSLHNIVVLSGGTDGEDGPTDAAGACADAEIMQRAKHLQLAPADSLAINDSYHFFEACGGLLKTGPTHTNVMDLRVVLVAP